MSWSRIQSASGTALSVTSLSAAYASSLSSGSTLIAVVCNTVAGTGAPTTTGVSDGNGHSFTEVIPDFGLSHFSVSVWALNTPSGDVGTKPAITATLSGTTAGSSVLIQEVAGIITASTAAGFIDGTAGTSDGTGSGAIGPPSYASSAAGEYLVSIYADDGTGATWTAPSGYTADPSGINTSGIADLAVSYKSSTGGTESGQYSLSGSAQWGLILAAFKLAPDGATMWRLMDGKSGRPGNGPGSPTARTGNSQAGMIFGVTDSRYWFQGYYWWVPSGGDTGAQKFCLYSMDWYDSALTHALIPAATVTSGTLTAGAWNFVPLATPVQLSAGSGGTATGGMYLATTAWTAVNGYPDTAGQFGTSDLYGSGITSGPLFTFGQGNPAGTLTAGSTAGTAGSDPAAATPPTATDGTFDNFWLDVQVTSIAPAGYAGSYRLWPNRGIGGANAVTSGDSAVGYVIGTEVHLSGQCTVNNIWYFSPSGTTQLATRASVWTITGADAGSEVVAVTSPSWHAPGGGAATAGEGWCYAPVPGGPALAAGHYKVAVFNGAGSPVSWSVTDDTSGYWLSAEGSAGITSGPVSAPSVAASSAAYVFNPSAPGSTPPYTTGSTQPGQGTFVNGGGNGYPYLYWTAGLGENLWVDLEVTPPAEGNSATYVGTEVYTYPQYLDASTGKTLVAHPGITYDIAIASGYVNVGALPDDGRWIAVHD